MSKAQSKNPPGAVSPKGKMMILVGPSAVGKSTFLAQAVKDFPELVDTITCTTRPMRPGEKEGNPYYFLSRQEFEEKVAQGYFVEFAEVHGNLYGTPRNQIEDNLAQGKTVIMDVDVQGARTFKRKYPQSLTIFIHPPSFEVLRERLLKRDGTGAKDIELRLKNAQEELATAQEFDRQLVNGDFAESYAVFKKIIEEVLGNR